MISPSCWFTVPLPLFVDTSANLPVCPSSHPPPWPRYPSARCDPDSTRYHGSVRPGTARRPREQQSPWNGNRFHSIENAWNLYGTKFPLTIPFLWLICHFHWAHWTKTTWATRCCFATPQNQAAPRSALSLQAEKGVILLTRNGGPQRSGPSNEVLQTPPPKPTVNTWIHKNAGIEINYVKGSANISNPHCVYLQLRKTILILGWISKDCREIWPIPSSFHPFPPPNHWEKPMKKPYYKL